MIAASSKEIINYMKCRTRKGQRGKSSQASKVKSIKRTLIIFFPGGWFVFAHVPYTKRGSFGPTSAHPAIMFSVLFQIPLRLFNLFTALLASVARIGAGNFVASGLEKCKRPKVPLELYEYEACPFCRKVREALCILDLDCIIYPCPRETLMKQGWMSKSRFRPEVKSAGGKNMFPFLVDNNTGVKMYESSDIVKYLWKTYGSEATPSVFDRIGNLPIIAQFTLFLASSCRPFLHHGMMRTESKRPEKILELWSMEGSPFCRLVREALSTLEIPYKLRNVGHGSTEKRKEFKDRFSDKHLNSGRKALGMVKVPFLVDPNENVEMSESADIVNYLYKTYAVEPGKKDE